MRPHPLPSLDQQIGALLREARLSQGVTQDEVARALGVNRTTVARYESGTRSLSVSTLLHIAQVLGVPPTMLLPVGQTPGPPLLSKSLAPQERSAVATLVGVLEQCPELVPQVLETVERLLQATSSTTGLPFHADGTPPNNPHYSRAPVADRISGGRV